MIVVKQVLGKAVQFGGEASGRPVEMADIPRMQPEVRCLVNFRILQADRIEDAEDLPYRFEWQALGEPDAAHLSGSLAAESIEDAEDMGLQYFGIQGKEWTQPSPN